MNQGDDLYAKASRNAMRAYAQIIKSENPLFAGELNAWVNAETPVSDGEDVATTQRRTNRIDINEE